MRRTTPRPNPLEDFPRSFRVKMWFERHTGYPRMPRGHADYGGHLPLRKRLLARLRGER
jgi:hypothetical protein